MRNMLKAIAGTLALTGPTSAHPQGRQPREPRQIEITVTSDGFQPAEIKTKAGEPLRLIVTRRTDRTCAKEVVIKDLGVAQPLPLDQPVTIDITPKKTGQLRYACGMDMVSGVISVE